MAFANVNIGSTADDGTGDPLRTAFTKINQNFANIASGSISVTAPVQTVANRTGNITLTISDVAGAVPYGYVNSGLIGANTYTNAAVANISTTVYNQVVTNLATNIANIIIADVTANINSTVLAPVNANVAAANTHIQTLDANVGSFYTYANATYSVGGYSNATVASYLPVYTGNISANHITPIGNTSTGFKQITGGLQSGYVAVPYYLAQFTTNSNSYSQINIQNINSGNQSTTDYIATANNGTDTTYFVDLGIAGNAYNGLNINNSLGTVLNYNDAYLYAQGNIGTGYPGGNLIIGTVTPNTSIKFIAGGPNSANVALTINNPGTDPVNNTTGALVINGGMGVTGNINIGSIYNYALHTIRGNLLLGAGNVMASADSILTLNVTSATPIVNTNAVLHISGGSNNNTMMGVDSFGTNGTSGVVLRHARGNNYAPSAVLAGDRLGGIFIKGYGTTGYSFLSGAGLIAYADENITDTSMATRVSVTTIKTGAIESSESVRIGSEGNVVIVANTVSSSVNTGALVVKGGAGVAGNVAVGGNLNVTANTYHTGTTTLIGNTFQQGQYYETYSNVSNTGGNLTLNFINGGVYYATLTANVTVNVTNIANTAFTTAGFTVIVDQGATPYRIANIQFAGGTVTSIKWAGATVPTGTASNTDVISISLINLNNDAYRILGQQSNYA